jgi:DNA-binding CsgD family transcriptional regulator
MDAHRRTALSPRPARGRSGATAALLDVLTEFRASGTARALVEEAPEAIARLGFDRVLISRVNDGIWLPESMFVRRDPQWASAIIQAGRDQVITLDSVVETDVVDAARALVVDEVQTHPRVCRPIAAVSRSDNYGVAPIIVDQTVVGMVHADCYVQRRPVHREECDTLAVAAESLAAHLSRLLLREQLHAIREVAAAPSWTMPCINPGLAAPVQTLETRAELTARELDVMRLMAAGETNYRIARRLNISEGTVKTHVSKILNKLDAASRTQAVSLWLQKSQSVIARL